MLVGDLTQHFDEPGTTIFALDSPAHRSLGGAEVLLPEHLWPSLIKSILKVGVHVLYLLLHFFERESMRVRKL
jgi:hypothetical protein